MAEIEIDGEIVEEIQENLVRVRLASPASSAQLRLGDSVAFRPVSSDSDDRYLGTILSVPDNAHVVALLDREAMTQQLSRQTETGESPFTPTRNTSGDRAGEVYG